MKTIKYWIAYAKAVVLQTYYDLAELDGLPFQLIRQDYDDRRRLVPLPKRPSAED